MTWIAIGLLATGAIAWLVSGVRMGVEWECPGCKDRGGSLWSGLVHQWDCEDLWEAEE